MLHIKKSFFIAAAAVSMALIGCGKSDPNGQAFPPYGPGGAYPNYLNGGNYQLQFKSEEPLNTGFGFYPQVNHQRRTTMNVQSYSDLDQLYVDTLNIRCGSDYTDSGPWWWSWGPSNKCNNHTVGLSGLKISVGLTAAGAELQIEYGQNVGLSILYNNRISKRMIQQTINGDQGFELLTQDYLGAPDRQIRLVVENGSFESESFEAVLYYGDKEVARGTLFRQQNLGYGYGQRPYHMTGPHGVPGAYPQYQQHRGHQYPNIPGATPPLNPNWQQFPQQGTQPWNQQGRNLGQPHYSY